MTKRRDKKPTVMAGPTTAKMKSFLVKKPVLGTLRTEWALFFCRGEENGCPRGPVHRKLGKTPCTDCVRGKENETVGDLIERLKNREENSG